MNYNDTNHIQALCFDFDGTVADTMPFLAEIAVNIMGKYYDVDEIVARKKYIETTGLPFEQQIHSIFPENANNPKAIQEFEELKKKNYFTLKPVKNIQNVLQTLKEKGYSVVISSSTFQELITEYVNIYALPHDLALGYKSNFKKGKDHFDYIIDTLQVSREHVCYIGDSLNDYRLATTNNIAFIAKIGLFSAEAFSQLDTNIMIIHDMEELLSIF